MSSKKSLRRKRREAEQGRSHSERNPVTLFILVIATALFLLVGGAMLFGGGSSPGDPPWPGAVWSSSHGHWH